MLRPGSWGAKARSTRFHRPHGGDQSPPPAPAPTRSAPDPAPPPAASGRSAPQWRRSASHFRQEDPGLQRRLGEVSGRAAGLPRAPGVGGRPGRGCERGPGSAPRAAAAGPAGALLLSGLGIAVVEGPGLRARSPLRDPGGHHADRALHLERPHPAVGWESGVGGKHVDKQGNVR
ncbi:unnamed protein product [Rangifer tarandus platyrhynchus]|uniref:Uncharacterized protein n=1 Tax=Rangifer tarandus platyrhynchus TaxID=3082113 RepID=A0ABN8XZL6_RANTA|nr:unnamed protein product [Rangifer tarandus platyrhynchus]